MLNFFDDKLNIVVSCASGVEKVLKTELYRLGYGDPPANNGMVEFSGTFSDVVKCNLRLRTADRVYVKLGEFPVDTFDLLFDGVYSIDWQKILPKNSRILVDGKCVKSKLFAISACQSIIKKAIVKKLANGKDVPLTENGAEYKIFFSVFKDVATIYLNTSGQGLHKRGYRDLVGIAPIKETLASALLLLSDFYYKRPFHDPFCGSGTLVIEGARIALNIAPGKDRHFDFLNWKNFDKRIYDQLKSECLDLERKDVKLNFSGSDIDPKAVKLAKRHAMTAGVGEYVDFSVCDVNNFKPKFEYGTIVTNPPYGERVYDKEQAEECYKALGKALKDYEKWSLFVITSAKNFEKFYGKRADRDRKLYNSNKECRYYYYYGKKESER